MIRTAGDGLLNRKEDRTGPQKFLLFIILSCYFAITGCAAVVAGAGAGAGVYAFINGELKKSYPATFDRALRASIDTLNSLNMIITEKQPGGIQTVLKAEQSDGTPVTLKIEQTAPERTTVSIRSGVVGIWERHVSELIHARIAQQL